MRWRPDDRSADDAGGWFRRQSDDDLELPSRDDRIGAFEPAVRRSGRVSLTYHHVRTGDSPSDGDPLSRERRGRAGWLGRSSGDGRWRRRGSCCRGDGCGWCRCGRSCAASVPSARWRRSLDVCLAAGLAPAAQVRRADLQKSAKPDRRCHPGCGPLGRDGRDPRLLQEHAHAESIRYPAEKGQPQSPATAEGPGDAEELRESAGGHRTERQQADRRCQSGRAGQVDPPACLTAAAGKHCHVEQPGREIGIILDADGPSPARRSRCPLRNRPNGGAPWASIDPDPDIAYRGARAERQDQGICRADAERYARVRVLLDVPALDRCGTMTLRRRMTGPRNEQHEQGRRRAKCGKNGRPSMSQHHQNRQVSAPGKPQNRTEVATF
jgi:hypothetical protein